jgi:hypothetical protein
MPKNPTKSQLLKRIPKARADSAAAFVIRIVTGKAPQDVDPNDLLSVYGYTDQQKLDGLAYVINKAKWHGVQVSDFEIEKSKTIDDVIKVVSSHMRSQTQQTNRSK